MLRYINNLKIKTRFILLCIALISLVMLYSRFMFSTVNLLRVDGVFYKRIIENKDIIADVLPPPKYVVEYYLTLYLLSRASSLTETERHLEKLRDLEGIYLKRQSFWLKHLADGQLKSGLTELAHEPAMNIFRITNNEFIPAILSAERPRAEKILLDKIAPLYKEHRRHIDMVVELSRSDNVRLQAQLKDILKKNILYLRIAIGMFLFCIICWVAYFIRLLTVPLSKLSLAAQRIGEGELESSLSEFNFRGEFGELAAVIEKMRISLKENIQGFKDEISERQIAEHELLLARNSLEFKVKERTEELEEVNRSLIGEIAEHKSLQLRLDIQYEVASLLSRGESLAQVVESVLKIICQRLRFIWGEFWEFDEQAGVLKNYTHWCADEKAMRGFIQATKETVLKHGEGLPGRIWKSGNIEWISDLSKDTNFPRLQSALKANINSAVGLPIKFNDKLAGVIAFMSSEPRQTDYGLEMVLFNIGLQIVQFLKRCQAVDEIRDFNQVLENCVLERTKDLESANKELKEANSLNEVLIDTIPFGMDIVDGQGNILAASPKIELIFGRELTGRKCWELYKDDKKQCSECPLFKEITLGQTHTLEVPGVLGGRIFQITHTGMVFKGKKAVLEIFQDVTEQKKQEELLEKNKAQLQALLEGTTAVVTIKDIQGKFIHVNNRFLEILGLHREEVIGKDSLELFPREIAETLRKNDAQVLELNNSLTIEENLIHGDGSLRTYVSVKLPLKASDGKPYAVCSISTDITARKEFEEQLRKAHEELKATQAQLIQSAKMASVGQLAGGVAHEINNPLTGVLNNVQLIKMLAAQKQEFNIGDFKELLDVIEESALRCVKITRSLLDFSHSSNDTLQPVKLNEIVEKVTTLVSHELRLQNVAIEKQLDENLPDIIGENQLLQQVVFELITNAKWAIQKNESRPGPGKIIIRTWLDRQKDKVFISIEDNGIGIPEEHIDKIFEPFFTTKPVGEGTGLGLAIIYGIVNKHKGIINMESMPGKGTVFRLGFISA